MDPREFVSSVILPAFTEGFFIALRIIVVFLAAWIVDGIVSRLLWSVSKALRLEERIEKAGLSDALFGFSLTSIVDILIKAYIYFLAIAIAGEVADISVLQQWGTGAVSYMQNAIQGVILLVITLFVADYVTDRIRESRMFLAHPIASAIQIFIIYNGIVLALPNLLPSADTSLLKSAFLILLATFGVAFSLGLGIAIGLGMKDTIASIAKKHQRTLERILS